MSLVNVFKFTKTSFDWVTFAKATRNRFRVVSARPSHDKKGILDDGYTYTLTILEDDFDYGVDKEGKPRENNQFQNFDVTVLNRNHDVKKGDIVSLIGFDEEHSYVIKFDLILRFKDLKLIPKQPVQTAGRPNV